MRYKQAMEFVADAAKDVAEIVSAEHSGEGWQRALRLRTANGSLSVDAEYGCPDYWFRHDSEGKDPTVDRVRITAGHCRTEGGRHGKKVTRTFRVRDDGTLNGIGIKKALRELAELKEREVVQNYLAPFREGGTVSLDSCWITANVGRAGKGRRLTRARDTATRVLQRTAATVATVELAVYCCLAGAGLTA